MMDIGIVIAKITAEGNESVLLTERGVSFCYNNLVVDVRAFPMQVDCGHVPHQRSGAHSAEH